MASMILVGDVNLMNVTDPHVPFARVGEELRAAQVEAVREIKPSCAIIAGGQPAHAAALEKEGIPTFLEGERMGSASMYPVATSRTSTICARSPTAAPSSRRQGPPSARW